jgi:hypothetical protein
VVDRLWSMEELVDRTSNWDTTKFWNHIIDIGRQRLREHKPGLPPPAHEVGKDRQASTPAPSERPRRDGVLHNPRYPIVPPARSSLNKLKIEENGAPVE